MTPVLHPLSGGPSLYCVGREWLPLGWHNAAYAPADRIMARVCPPFHRAMGPYGDRWLALDIHHAASD